MHENYDLELLMELVQTRQFRRLRELLVNMNEVDIAEFLDELGPEETVLVFRLLPKEVAAEVFTELEDSDDQERLINALSDKELREVLDELYLDDTVDLIEDMPANLVSRILRNTDSTTRSQINQLLNYPKDSAGSIMTTEYVYLHPNATVEESFARIRKVGMDKETIYTCYVTQNRVLLGVVTVRRMLLSSYETRIGDIMETNVLSVNTHEDKEDVSQLLNKYDLSPCRWWTRRTAWWASSPSTTPWTSSRRRPPRTSKKWRPSCPRTSPISRPECLRPGAPASLG